MIEAVFGGLLTVIVNIWQMENTDFFYWKSVNEKAKECTWEYVGKTTPKGPSITLYGNIYWKHQCEEKFPVAKARPDEEGK